MKKICVAEYASRTGKDISFDMTIATGFDRDAVVQAAREEYANLDAKELEELDIYVSAYDYDEASADPEQELEHGGYDPDAILFDGEKDDVASFGPAPTGGTYKIADLREVSHTVYVATLEGGDMVALTGWNGERWNEGRPAALRHQEAGISLDGLDENSYEYEKAMEPVSVAFPY